MYHFAFDEEILYTLLKGTRIIIAILWIYAFPFLILSFTPIWFIALFIFTVLALSILIGIYGYFNLKRMFGKKFRIDGTYIKVYTHNGKIVYSFDLRKCKLHEHVTVLIPEYRDTLSADMCSIICDMDFSPKKIYYNHFGYNHFGLYYPNYSKNKRMLIVQNEDAKRLLLEAKSKIDAEITNK